MNESIHTSSRPVSVEEVIAEFLGAADAGRPPDRDELVARFPEISAGLAEFFADYDRLSDLAAPFRPPPQPVADNATPFGEPPTPPWSPADDSGSEPPGGRFGDYDLLEEVSRGGMGVVFKAAQVSLNRIVAVKMILVGRLASREDVLRFRAEAEAAAGLQHPNIVAIHEVGEHDGQHFFSMDYVEGPSLAELIRQHPLPAPDAARLVKTIAEAIQYAHQKGVLHRDLKPSNVLLQGSGFGVQGSVNDPDKRIGSGTEPDARAVAKRSSFGLKPEPRTLNPVITDFGLARRIESTSDLTGSGQVLGTPSYMPPEQAAGTRGEIGPASDIYSLGAILYELLAGRPPFRAETPIDTLLQLLESEPVPLRLLHPRLPRDLETICMKCLHKQPERRYATAQELADDLGRFLTGEPIRARAVGRIERTWRWCKRRPAWAMTIGVSALALALIAFGSLWFNRQLGKQLARTEQTQRELQIALARQVAERLDSDLRQLAAVPHSLAALLGERSDWTEAQLDRSLRELLDADLRLFGMCVAFEPGQFQPDREHYARYIYRSSEERSDTTADRAPPKETLSTRPPSEGPAISSQVRLKYLHPPEYRPYREWDWYRNPQDKGRAVWSEPYIDWGGGDVPMVTYSEPIHRNSQFIGVVTVDLSLAYFRQLKRWLDELQLSRGDYGFVVSRAGKLISDANSEYQMGRSIDEFATTTADPAFGQLVQLIRHQQPGAVHGPDLWTGNPVRYLAAPVQSTGWSFVAVIPEAER